MWNVESPTSSAHRMCQQLRKFGLSRKDAARSQNSRDLTQGFLTRVHVVARSEIDDGVKRSTGKGQLSEVGLSQANGRSPGCRPSRFGQQSCVNVDACQEGGSQERVKGWQGDASAAADLEDAAAGRQPQGANEEWNLNHALEEVPVSLVGKGLVLRLHQTFLTGEHFPTASWRFVRTGTGPREGPHVGYLLYCFITGPRIAA